jgi:hypothetical protein
MAKPEDPAREKNGPGVESGARVVTPRDLRFEIYCPSCGALNYVDGRKDFYRGSCAECGSPFRFPATLSRAPRREVAYPVLAAVLTAFIWILFFSGRAGDDRAGHGEKVPPPAQSHLQKMELPPPPAATTVKKFPLPPAPVPPKESAAPAPPQAAPSSPPTVPGSQAPASPPAVPGSPPADKAAPAEKPPDVPKAPLGQSRSEFDETTVIPAQRVSSHKHRIAPGKTNNILEIPLPVAPEGRD